jgi:hypothetical protein
LYTGFEEDALVSLDPSSHPQDPTEYDDAFNVYIDARGVPGESTLLRWRVTGIYEMRAFPERARQATRTGFILVPLPCSGYVAHGLTLVKVGECTCCQCWLYEFGDISFISDNQNVRDVEFKKVNLGRIPITSMRFYSHYYLQVEQLSISEEVYAFWKLVNRQQTSNGNIFQPNAVKIRGNVKSVDNPEEEVLGIFSVSGVVSTNMFIERSDVPYEVEAIDTLTVDCRDYANSTTTKPLFW